MVKDLFSSYRRHVRVNLSFWVFMTFVYLRVLREIVIAYVILNVTSVIKKCRKNLIEYLKFDFVGDYHRLNRVSSRARVGRGVDLIGLQGSTDLSDLTCTARDPMKRTKKSISPILPDDNVHTHMLSCPNPILNED